MNAKLEATIFFAALAGALTSAIAHQGAALVVCTLAMVATAWHICTEGTR